MIVYQSPRGSLPVNGVGPIARGLPFSVFVLATILLPLSEFEPTFSMFLGQYVIDQAKVADKINKIDIKLTEIKKMVLSCKIPSKCYSC